MAERQKRLWDVIISPAEFAQIMTILEDPQLGDNYTAHPECDQQGQLVLIVERPNKENLVYQITVNKRNRN